MNAQQSTAYYGNCHLREVREEHHQTTFQVMKAAK
jgi:hypothetical protein